MDVNWKRFFDCVRKQGWWSGLTQSQVDGMKLLISKAVTFFAEKGHTEEEIEKFTAYVLATVHHETGGRFEPVREGFASSDEQAMKAVRRLKRRGIISYDYSRPKGPYKKSYFGRGYVQLTHYTNYRKMGRKLGIPLDAKPELALDPETSADITILGMYHGVFTGVGLPKYLSGGRRDFVQARRIVNGLDKAGYIAGYAKKYWNCLRHSIRVGDIEQPTDSAEEPEEFKYLPTSADLDAEIPKKPLTKSTTIWASIIAFVTPVFTILETIATDHPFLAVGTVGIMAMAILWIIKERLGKHPRLEW